MSIVSIDDFKLDYSIPNLHNLGGNPTFSNSIVVEVNQYISKYEAIYMNDMFSPNEIESIYGYFELPTEQQVDDDMNTLILKLKDTIAHFVFYNYCKDKSSTFTSVGESKENVENATIISPIKHLTKVWNDMVSINLTITNKPICQYNYLLKTINEFNI